MANNTFITEHVLIGLGEFVTPEKQALIDEFTTSLNDLIAYLETITKTDKEKEDLTEGLYAPTETYEATEAFITRANNLLAQNIINDTELANYRLEILTVRNTLNTNVFIGTNENAINALKQNLLAEIERLEALIDSYKKTDETDEKKLKKGETYIPLSQISSLKMQINSLRNQVENASSLEALEEINTTVLEPFETTINQTTIVGTKAPGLSVEMIIYIAIGCFVALMFITVTVLVVKVGEHNGLFSKN